MTGEGNWTWLLPGRVPTLIDAGTGDPRHLNAIDEALGGDTLSQVIVTHAHSDHAAGAPALRERWPNARFFKMPWPSRDDRAPVPWIRMADRDAIQAGDTSLAVVHTPGHAPDHICLWHLESRILFGGDLAIADTTVFIPAGSDGDAAAYMRSLERVLALNPRRLLPAHGPAIEDPTALLRAYIRHRRQRELQIIDAIRRGVVTPDDMVARIYSGLDETLRSRARETVIAHLRKLEREGRVQSLDDTWHIIEK
jgi:glyoxylase-like metal-dependent hydrolase (beta-lactamase superfamily II)